MNDRVRMLAIIGDSGSGKNTVADAVSSLLGSVRVTDLRLDDYRRYTRDERAEFGLTPLHPKVHDHALMREHLLLLRQGQAIRNRSYRHEDGTFGPIRSIEPREIVLARGLLAFPAPEMQELFDLSVFLQPEPELLFRWKLRRDVLFRGYKEADVLKTIASHLLDAKEFVLPQADRADLLVHYALPDWEAPDSEVLTTIRFRNGAAELVARGDIFRSLPIESEAEGCDHVVRVPPDIPDEAVDTWAREHYADRYDARSMGSYFDGDGEPCRRASLAFVEVLIARLAEEMAVHPA